MSNISRASSFLVNSICSRDVSGVGIHCGRKFGLIGKLFNIKNEIITFSYHGKIVRFDSEKLFKLVDRAVYNSNGNKKTEWFKDETVSLLSSEVNKVIDFTCKKYGFVINGKDKERIFHKLSSGLGAIELDSRYTQSSISKILYKDKYFSDKVNGLYYPRQLRYEKNQLMNLVNSKLTDVVFMNKFGGVDLNQVRKNTAAEIALIMKLKKPAV